jgi:hypothetical protein
MSSTSGSAAERNNALRLGINTRKTMRNVLGANYVITVTVRSLDNDNKQVTVLVTWDWKERTRAGGNPNTHQVVGLLRST